MRFNEDKSWRKHNCILTHGGGQPPRGVRRMLHRLRCKSSWRCRKLIVAFEVGPNLQNKAGG